MAAIWACTKSNCRSFRKVSGMRVGRRDADMTRGLGRAREAHAADAGVRDERGAGRARAERGEMSIPLMPIICSIRESASRGVLACKVVSEPS